ncbi:NAT9 [Bugula neritina]|uniref:N-acetyltransferase 9-like protein n=1 Tax=Bugula neritina TaxID=10212 RepID=A0A7J7JHF4_BUGNE|nr:NAT9 [Bugula neritina]
MQSWVFIFALKPSELVDEKAMKTNENQAICLPKCILVPYCEKHVLKYHEWMKSEELQVLTASEPLSLEEEYQMQISWYEDDKKCTFIILDKDLIKASPEDEISAMVGDVNLFFNDLDNIHCAELEIMVAEMGARGKGIGKQATLAIMNYGVLTLGVDTFIVKIGYQNTPSIELFKKLGFQEISRSEAFQEITFQLSITEDKKLDIQSSLEEYSVCTYSNLQSVLLK